MDFGLRIGGEWVARWIEEEVSSASLGLASAKRALEPPDRACAGHDARSEPGAVVYEGREQLEQ